MPSRFHPTIPVDEYAAERVPVFLSQSDLDFLVKHLNNNQVIDEQTREMCARIRFRCLSAAHKLYAPASEVLPSAGCDFMAFVSMVSKDSGGRQSKIYSGFRPQLYIDSDDCDVELILATDSLDPGASGIVYGRFFNPDRNLHKLAVGKAILLREGARTIGYGTLVWRRVAETDHNREPIAT